MNNLVYANKNNKKNLFYVNSNNNNNSNRIISSVFRQDNKYLPI